jgi:hypothetical protein
MEVEGDGSSGGGALNEGVLFLLVVHRSNSPPTMIIMIALEINRHRLLPFAFRLSLVAAARTVPTVPYT